MECGKATGGRIVTVEDHYYEGELIRPLVLHPSPPPPHLSLGGLGEAVAGAVAEDGGIKVRRLAVDKIPRSGPGSVLMEMHGISASCIVKAVDAMVA